MMGFMNLYKFLGTLHVQLCISFDCSIFSFFMCATVLLNCIVFLCFYFFCMESKFLTCSSAIILRIHKLALCINKEFEFIC